MDTELGFTKANCYNTSNDSFINNLIKAEKFINNKSNIIITKAGKSDKTIIMNKYDYKNKIVDLLNDKNTNITLKKDPTSHINDDATSFFLNGNQRNILATQHTNIYIIIMSHHQNFTVFQSYTKPKYHYVQ